MSALSSVERNALLVLAAMGGSAAEGACLRAQFQVNLNRVHRERLQALGLVTVSGRRRFELSLTEEGRLVAGEALASLRAEGLSRISNHLVLRLLARFGKDLQMGERPTSGAAPVVSSPGSASEGAAPAREVVDTADVIEGADRGPPTDRPESDGEAGVRPDTAAAPRALEGEDVYAHLLAEGARAESDLALARSLQDMPSFARQIRRLEVGLSGAEDMLGLARQVDLAAGQVFQSVRQAALRRGLRERHARGETMSFDAAAYESDLPIQQGEPALVVRSAIVRGEGEEERVVLRGRADPC